MNENLTVKKVIVTGASSGIGRAVAERFLGEGAHVALVARREYALKQVSARPSGGKAFVVAAAVVQLTPPLIVRQIVDGHLTPGKPEGLLPLALLYLGATAGAQGLTFAYGYVAALVAQGFKSVRTLAEREGLVFVEGIKPR